MAGIVKVGFSTKDPELRASELNNTGAPHPYVVEYDVLVQNPRDIEQRVHRRLMGHREAREWFRCSPEFAVVVIQEVVGGGAMVESFKKADRARAEALRLEKDELAQRERAVQHKYEERLRSEFPRLPIWPYVVGVFLLAVPVVASVGPRFQEGVLLFWSLVIGVIGGLLGRAWHQQYRVSSTAYQAIIGRRDEEVASLKPGITREKGLQPDLNTGNSVVVSCPTCKQGLRVPRTGYLKVTCTKCLHAFPYTG
jgi:hypothetical protein